MNFCTASEFLLLQQICISLARHDELDWNGKSTLNARIEVRRFTLRRKLKLCGVLFQMVSGGRPYFRATQISMATLFTAFIRRTFFAALRAHRAARAAMA